MCLKTSDIYSYNLSSLSGGSSFGKPITDHAFLGRVGSQQVGLLSLFQAPTELFIFLLENIPTRFRARNTVISKMSPEVRESELREIHDLFRRGRFGPL
jgi:hypothetical protein